MGVVRDEIYGSEVVVSLAACVRPPEKPQVPKEIMRPDYAEDGIPKAKSPMLPWVIEVKNEKDIEGMRAAGRVARYEKSKRRGRRT